MARRCKCLAPCAGIGVGPGLRALATRTMVKADAGTMVKADAGTMVKRGEGEHIQKSKGGVERPRSAAAASVYGSHGRMWGRAATTGSDRDAIWRHVRRVSAHLRSTRVHIYVALRCCA